MHYDLYWKFQTLRATLIGMCQRKRYFWIAVKKHEYNIILKNHSTNKFHNFRKYKSWIYYRIKITFNFVFMASNYPFDIFKLSLSSTFSFTPVMSYAIWLLLQRIIWQTLNFEGEKRSYYVALVWFFLWSSVPQVKHEEVLLSDIRLQTRAWEKTCVLKCKQ